MTESKVLPTHIGIIMDGNGRWAKKRGMPRTYGHREGAKVCKKIVNRCIDLGIKYLTLYAFSTENWKRPQDEVDELMRLFDKYLDEIFDNRKQKARILFLGDKAPFPAPLRMKMEKLERESEEYSDRTTVMFAMNYGGRDDIVHAARRAAQLVAEGGADPGDIDEKMLDNLLYTSGAADADLIIRPGGEKRLSNFLLWQSAYAELYFSDVLWPDFDEKELDKALNEFALRSRRFGGV